MPEFEWSSVVGNVAMMWAQTATRTEIHRLKMEIVFRTECRALRLMRVAKRGRALHTSVASERSILRHFHLASVVHDDLNTVPVQYSE